MLSNILLQLTGILSKFISIIEKNIYRLDALSLDTTAVQESLGSIEKKLDGLLQPVI